MVICKDKDKDKDTMTKTNTERGRRIPCCVKLMSGGGEGVLGPGITSCRNQEWSLTDGFRDSNALSPSWSHAQITKAIFATILAMDMIIMISTILIIIVVSRGLVE